MSTHKAWKVAGIGLAAAATAAAAGYAALVVINRARYGDATYVEKGAVDSMLDRFMPEPEVAEHHHITIDAPADVVLATAKEMELLRAT